MPQGGGTAMLGTPAQPMELAADGRTATASFIVAGVLEGHYLHLPPEVAVASRTLFDGKPVVWDHVMPTEDKEVGQVLNTWATSEDAVLGQFSVNREDHRKVLRAFRESGMGGMSARIRFREDNGFITRIEAVQSVDVVLTPASKTQILQASQQTAGMPADTSWFAKARQFFSIPALVPSLSTPKEPETPQEAPMTEEERAALLEAVKATIAEELKPHTAMLTEVQTQVSTLAQVQADAAAETTHKASIRAKLTEELPDANKEMLAKLVNLAYAQRGPARKSMLRWPAFLPCWTPSRALSLPCRRLSPNLPPPRSRSPYPQRFRSRSRPRSRR